MGTIEHSAPDLGARVARAEPEGGSVGAEAMLGRVLQHVLDEPAEPLTAGRYVILEAVGRGGVGEVYAAYDPELDRRVAIKLVRAGIACWDDLDKRMLREAQAMAKVRHPNVVAIHDVGRFRDQVFIAMELVEGATLSAWCRGRTRRWQDIRDVFVQACRGLAAVHAAGLVQRDFKPANVLVGNDGVVKVLDFGLARAVAETAGAGSAHPAIAGGLLDEELTRAGVVAGTPAYMAPEQCYGALVDAKADQFAFCVALYEALYDERPFPGSDLALRLKAITSAKLAPPTSTRPVPAWLRQTILKGLVADPANRHDSMTALLAELDRDKRRRTRTWLAIGAAAVLSAIATSVAFVAYEPAVTEQQLEQVQRLVDEARAAAASHDFIYPPLEAPERPTAYSRLLALEHLDGPISSRATAHAATLRTEFSQTLTALGDAYSERDGGAPFAAEFYTAAVLFDANNEHARTRSLLTTAQLASLKDRIERQEFGKAELVAGASLAALAEPDDAERRKKVARLQARRTGVPASTMASLDTLVGAEIPPERGVVDKATAPAKAATPPNGPAGAAEPRIRPPAPDDRVGDDAVPSGTATQLAKEGLAALRKRELERAQTLLNRAIAKDRKNATALGGLATLYFELGRYADAVTYAKRAVAAAPKHASHHVTLGDAYYKVLRYADAREAYLEAQRLGATTAQRGLDRVDAKLGLR